MNCEGNKIELYNDGKRLLTLEGCLDFEIEKGIRSIYYLAEEPVSRICFKGKLKNGRGNSAVKLIINN